MRGFYRVRLKPDPTKRGGAVVGSAFSRTVSDRFPESRLQDFTVAAAERQTGSGSKEHDVLAIERRLHFLNAIDVDDRRAVDSDELLRVELRFEMAHRVAHEVLLCPDMDAHVVSLRLAPVDVGHAHEMNPPTGLDHQPVWPR